MANVPPRPVPPPPTLSGGGRTLTINRPATATAPKAKAGPKATITTEDGVRLTLPYAPREVDHGGLADSFATLDRPGRKPLLTYTADGLRSYSFTVLLAHRDHQTSVEPLIASLRAIAGSGDRVTVSLSALERGVWQLTDASIHTLLRQAGTNAVTRAEASLTFTEAIDAVVNVGPLSGGKKKKPGKKKHATGKAGATGSGKGGKATTQRYTVRAGDTLSRIALKFYGDPNDWPRIAKASGIRDPRALKVGARLTIPAA